MNHPTEKGYDSLDKMNKDIQEVISGTRISFLEVPSRDKTDTILRAISSGFMNNQLEVLRKVIDYVINYPDTMEHSLVTLF